MGWAIKTSLDWLIALRPSGLSGCRQSRDTGIECVAQTAIETIGYYGLIIKTKNKIALARLIQVPIMFVRKLFKLKTKVITRRKGFKWFLDLDEGIDFAIYLYGQFEPATAKAISSFVNPGDVVLDVGANIGAHTLPLAQVVGTNGRVIAFEPTKYAFSKLVDNLSLNPEWAERISLEQIMLLGDENSLPAAALYSSWPLGGSKQQHAKHCGKLESTEGAKACTLDSYIARNEIDRVKVVKIDVDGFEVEVVRGGLNFLKQQHPIIVMELAPYTLEERGSSLETLLGMLSDVGYVLRNQDNGHPLPIQAPELRAYIPDGGSINVVARASH